MRRVLALLALAAGPVLVLGVLFVLPVTGMVAEGFVVDGRFARARANSLATFCSDSPAHLDVKSAADCS